MPSATSFSSPTVALTIAGSDCSSGAGLQADLKTFTAHGVYGLTVVTSVVSEIPGKVRRLDAMEPSMVDDQLRLLLESYSVAALKTGLLVSADIIRVVANALRDLPAEKRPAIVVDPVMVATSGDSLIRSDAVEAYETELFPLATLLTPNMDEASVLLGSKLVTEADLYPAAESLSQRHGCAVLVKGGHLREGTALDVLHDAQGVETFSSPFFEGVHTHGTGCTYSAAIASHLALGHELRPAIRRSKEFISKAISQSFQWNHIQALNHFQQ